MTDLSLPSSKVAVVPARGGSKRIPHKNIRLFNGEPLLARTLKVLLDAEVFDRVIVSTDDSDIARISIDAGAEVPFLRPASLADDHTPAPEVIKHAIVALEEQSGTDVGVEYVCSVFPTAVLVTSDDLRRAFHELSNSSHQFVFAATSFGFPVQRGLRQLPGGGCEMLDPSTRLVRSQDLETVYHDAGQFCWGRRRAWLDDVDIFAPHSKMYLIPRHRVQDIDTPEDWQRAELIHRMIEIQPAAF